MVKTEKLNFPIFGLCFYKDLILFSGGGGGKKFAVRNEILVFKSNRMEKVSSLDTGDDLLSSIHYLPKSDSIIGCLGKDIAFYSISSTSKTHEIKLIHRFNSEKSKTLSIVKPIPGEKVLSAGEEGIISLWNIEKIENSQKVLQIDTHSEVFSCDGSDEFICAALKNLSCAVYSVKTGLKLKSLQFSDEPAKMMMMRASLIQGNYLITLASAHKSSYVTKWNLKNNFSPVGSVQVANTSASMAKISKSGKLAAIGTSSGEVLIVDISNLSIINRKQLFEMPATCCDFNSKDSSLTVGAADYSYALISISSRNYLLFLILALVTVIISYFLA